MLKFEKLSRAEMKNVLGGNMPLPSIKCNFGGTAGCGAEKDWGSCSNADDLDSCQDEADRSCAKFDCCDDATCKYV